MKTFAIEFIDWSEVWALFIPLIVLFRYRKQPSYLFPLVIYVFVSLYLNYLIDVMWKGKRIIDFPDWFKVNTYIYNVLSIIRFFLFSWFFIGLKQPFLSAVKKAVPVLFLIFVIINFSFFEKFINYWYDEKGILSSTISTKLFTAESVGMLFYCIQYYFFKLQEEKDELKRPPDFWIVTGLSIYYVSNFLIFLFYERLLSYSPDFAVFIWTITNITFIILCTFIARAFYISRHE